MTTNFETLDFPETQSILNTSYVFERIDYKARELAYDRCFKKVNNFLLSSFDQASLVLFNIKIADTKINRRIGIWSILEKNYGLSIPVGTRSEHFKVKGGYLFYICKVDIQVKDILCVISVLNKHRASLLVYGNLKIDDSFWDALFQSTEILSDTDPLSWSPLAIQITKRELVGVRLFGMFDDVENGVIVYESAKFNQTHGEWASR